MSGLIVLFIIVAALILFDVLAIQFGTDSRPDPSDRRHSW
jgi:hypothetical protein